MNNSTLNIEMLAAAMQFDPGDKLLPNKLGAVADLIPRMHELIRRGFSEERLG